MTLTQSRAAGWPKRGWLWAGAVIILASACAWITIFPRPTAPSTARVIGASAEPKSPPWIYGRANARFTIVEYADLQCEFCRAYFPILRKWIDEHPDVKWQWHHLPLDTHEPAATQAARLAECAGQMEGNGAFWRAVTWVYSNPTTSDTDHAVPAGFPFRSPSFGTCLESQRPDTAIQSDFQAAVHDGIQATPTLKLIDNASGRSLLLSGPVEGDRLLSAFDLLMDTASDGIGREVQAPPSAQSSSSPPRGYRPASFQHAELRGDLHSANSRNGISALRIRA